LRQCWQRYVADKAAAAKDVADGVLAKAKAGDFNGAVQGAQDLGATAQDAFRG